MCNIIRQKATSPSCHTSRRHLSATCTGQAHLPLVSGKQGRKHWCIGTMGWHMSDSQVPHPCLKHGSWTQTSLPVKRHLDRFSHFCTAHLICVPHRHTDHTTCSICSNRAHLYTACRWCGLIIIQIMEEIVYDL